MDRKRFAVCALLCVCVRLAVAQTAAPEQSSRESVMKFLNVTNIEKQAEQMQDVMMTQMVNAAKAALEHNPKLTPEQRERALAKMQPEMESFRNLYPISEMLEDMVPVYQRHFTETDLQAIIAFLQSAVGQKMLTETPRMMQESMQIIMPKLTSRVQARMDAMQKQMESNTNEENSTPGSKPPDTKPAPKKN